MKKVMWAIAIMFISGIFFWYGTGNQMKDAVAQVGSDKIKLDEYRKNVTRQLRREREKKEQELEENQIIEIRRQTLSSMINQSLLYQESKRLGIVVTDEEVINTIHNLPQFQQDEKFNFRLYQQTLRYSMNMKPDEFEKMIKINISNRKLERLILSSAKVTNSELQIYYINSNGDLKGFQEAKDELKNEILPNKRMALYQSWIKALQQNIKITVNSKLAGLKK